MRTSEVLNKAADLVQRHGLGHGVSTWRGEGGYCTEGAIAAAMGLAIEDAWNGLSNGQHVTYAVNSCPAGLAVRDYLGITDDGDRLWMWNDGTLDGKYSTSSKSKVIETLRACALIEEARENQSIEIKEEVSA